jgi:Haem-binding domain
MTDPPVNQAQTLAQNASISPFVAGLIKNSCYDCHSDETKWPWYSNIAPSMWLVANDVHKGRKAMNFSEWGTYTKSKRVVKLGLINDQVSGGTMPLSEYLFIHHNAELTKAERDSICTWAQGEGDRLSGEDN